ncbi:MAG: BamA/TamA family outer membrane protein [Steroidobacteraceae bacterium]
MTQTVFALLLAVAFGSAAQAADPQPYRVDIASVGDGGMDATVKATSDLLALRTTAPVSPFGLIARARSDVDRLTTALESFGYYQCTVVVKINGTALSNPGLAETLTALPKGSEAHVAIGFTLGPQYHLGSIDIDGDLPEGVQSTLGLTSGQPALASAVLAGGARLQTALQERGYAFAKVDPPVAYESATAPVLDLRFHVVVGSKANVGAVRFEGLKRVHEALLRARLRLHTGDAYSPSAIERARNDLLALGVFSQVSLQIGTALDDTGGVPVTFKVHERARHAIALGAAYSSDLGGSVTVSWTDRNVFGNAEQLTVKASANDLGGSDTTGLGYNTSATYLMQDFGRRDQSMQFSVGALKQSLQAYDQTARTSGVTLSRKISSYWTASVGGTTTDEQVVQNQVTYNYTLFASPLNVSFDSTKLASPLDDPRRGIRASLTLTPTLALGHPNATFVISQLKTSGYFDLDHLLPIDAGRTVLAASALAGLAQGAGQTSLPPDQRFYAGGSGTIRGYAYQSVGPKFPEGPDKDLPIGGTAIEAGGLELRQRFGANFGAAVFVDAGRVSANLRAVPGEVHAGVAAIPDGLRIGAGIGMRYYTPIGPIRLDVAVPVNSIASDRQVPGYGAFQVYIGLGQAF